MKRTVPVLVAFVLMSRGILAQQLPPDAVVLSPTSHPRVPDDLAQLWMVPEMGAPRTPAQTELARAIKLEVDGDFLKALPILTQPSIKSSPLASYAEYYAGLAELRLGHVDRARRIFQALRLREPIGYLAEAVALREAECDEALGDQAAALEMYERVSAGKPAAPDDVLMRLGRAAKLSGHLDRANQVFARVFYDYPLSEASAAAGAEFDTGPLVAGSARYVRGLDRAERLFVAKQYGLARPNFEALRPVAQGQDRELVNLRIAECDYFLKRPRDSKSELRPYLDGAARQAEALFFYAVSLRELKETNDYLTAIGRVADEFPTSTWAGEALNDLATYYIRESEDEKADQVLRRLYGRFPTGPNGERAAWKIGWSAYKKGGFAEAARIFEKASADFPRSDYRPMWLYWAGRAHELAGEIPVATARYLLAVTDYANTYHGRLATERLNALNVRLPDRRLVVDVKTVTASASLGDVPLVRLPANAVIIRSLLALDLYDQAIDELRYAQREWGNSSAVDATLGWTFSQQGRSLKGMDQLLVFRSGMNAMKRAYPHYLAAGGEALPPAILKVIFPIAYWDSIRKYADQFGLDPYLAAALIAQESTFVPDVKSYANAWGLTQLLPSTARQYAKVLKLGYTAKLLIDPEANLRMGMAYLADKIKEFGQVHLALASYNAGERPVHRWMSERPDTPKDEFIDDIPYPQTNGYVKKILGTAEDYRRLYGPEGVALASPAVTPIPLPVVAKTRARASSKPDVPRAKTGARSKSAASKKVAVASKKTRAKTASTKRPRAAA